MEKIKKLNELLADAVKKNAFPGVNYCLVAGEDTYFESFGNKSLIPNVEANDIDTLYDMASCTKVLSTTTCVLKLLEQGKIKLYDCIKTFIPEFIHSDITIWDLLTHSSGLPADVPGGSRIPTKELLKEKIMNVEALYPKNTNILYSDIGFILLGFMVENVSGLSLDQFAKQYVFDPLEMSSTGFNPEDINRCAPTEDRQDNLFRGIVRGKVHDEKAFTLGGVAGQAGLFSCVKDLEHFIRMILNGGLYNGKRILSQATVDLLFVPQVKMFKGISQDYEARGLGWIVKNANCIAGDLCSHETIMHTGFTGTSIFIDRINKIGFAMLSNRVHPTRNNSVLFPLRGRIANYIIANFGGK